MQWLTSWLISSSLAICHSLAQNILLLPRDLPLWRWRSSCLKTEDGWHASVQHMLLELFLAPTNSASVSCPRFLFITFFWVLLYHILWAFLVTVKSGLLNRTRCSGVVHSSTLTDETWSHMPCFSFSFCHAWPCWELFIDSWLDYILFLSLSKQVSRNLQRFSRGISPVTLGLK